MNKLLQMSSQLVAIYSDIRDRGLDRDEILEVYDFDQTWSSTALGFGGIEGIGGQAITQARTYIIVFNEYPKALVYFGGRFAYEADLTSDSTSRKFREDVRKHRVVSVRESGKYKDNKEDNREE